MLIWDVSSNFADMLIGDFWQCLYGLSKTEAVNKTGREQKGRNLELNFQVLWEAVSLWPALWF